MVPFRSHLAAWRVICAALFCVVTAPLRADDTNTVLNGWFDEQAKIKGLSTDFVQTRAMKTLAQPLTATGHLWFEPPDKFRWELGHPPRTIAIRHDDEMFVIYPQLKRAERYALGANAPAQFRDAMALMTAGFPTSREQFDSKFQIISLTQTNQQWTLDLQPRQSAARSFLPEMRIFLAVDNYLLTGTELVFADGSRMRNDFTNIVLNPPIDESKFKWEPPLHYTVVEPLAK